MQEAVARDIQKMDIHLIDCNPFGHIQQDLSNQKYFNNMAPQRRDPQDVEALHDGGNDATTLHGQQIYQYQPNRTPECADRAHSTE